MDADRCVSCGEIVPEGRMVCDVCEHQSVRVIVIYCPVSISRNPNIFESIAEAMQSLGESLQKFENSLSQVANYLSNIIISPISIIIKKREPDIRLRVITFIRATIIKSKPLYAVAKAVFRPG